MTLSEFDISTSSPRRSAPAEHTRFYAAIADMADERHENMTGLVQAHDFNPEIVVRFLRDNGIEAAADESSDGVRYSATDSERAFDVSFACVCLRASISYALEAAFWCTKAKQ